MAQYTKKMKIFVDANILFSGIIFPRWPNAVLSHALTGDIQLVLCPLTVKECRRNLEKKYPAFVELFELFLQSVNYELVPNPTLEEVKANKELVRDLSDVPVALAAIKAKADYLVSEDKDLTVKDKTTEELRKHVKIMISGTFLRKIMNWTSEQLESVRHRKWSHLSVKEWLKQTS